MNPNQPSLCLSCLQLLPHSHTHTHTHTPQDLHCVNVSSKAAVNPGAFDLFDVYSITKSAAHFMFGSLATRGARVLQVGAPPPPLLCRPVSPPLLLLTRRCCCRCAVLPLTRYPLLPLTPLPL